MTLKKSLFSLKKPKCNSSSLPEFTAKNSAPMTNLYRLRHLVENTFLKLKTWRAIATRYAKNPASSLAAVHVRAIAFWLQIY